MVRVYVTSTGDGGAAAAERMAERLAALGFNPFVPRHYHRKLFREERLPERLPGRSDLNWLSVCHALLLMPGWEECEDSRQELAHARELGIPAFTTVEELFRRFAPELEAGLELPEVLLEPQLIYD